METSPLNERASGSSYTEARENQATVSEDSEGAFICNICLDITTRDPVVTQCGHLYCWTCLYRWLNTNHTTCPVCKAGVTRDNVIPLFIRGAEDDPRNRAADTSAASTADVPNRPTGHRPDAQSAMDSQLFGNNATNAAPGVVAFSAGFGFFPSLFGLQFQSFPSASSSREEGVTLTDEEVEQLNLSRALIGLGGLVLLALLFF